MEEQECSSFQARKAKRIEQMVARWLRRSRDNLPTGRVSVTDCSSASQQFTAPVKITTVIHKDLFLSSYGFDISPNHPLTITSVIAGGSADGKLAPGDQILKINNEAVEDISVEQVAHIIRESEDSFPITVLRYPSGPKSSFLTAEKRARLKCNPVKVRFAEEVIVNGHAQGNSLLFMPNVLKVYLENGQTKAFKFEKKTTVKDIVLTLKEKLSIHSIEHFALALEEQYSISKLYLLHEDELIEQVVQKRESHDYRCLFRVCFVPRDPVDLLQEDPVAFEYLYLQSCSDVLQERFAVEMKCSVALRLAALHIQERIFSCAQPQKISMKYIEKDWGIENFISPTLLRNMRGKDIKKAINFHMKRNQALLEPRQKPLSAAQVRLNYLKILGELKTYGGKVFNATLLLQDRESYVALLVGAKYGISQIVNNKLNIMTILAEFANISRIELSPESEKVSMMKVYLQDVKPLSLLLESNSAKDLACLIAGYYKLFVDSGNSIFTWNGDRQIHRISAEEGYESRVCSDSEESSEFDSSLEFSSDLQHLKYSSIKPLHEEEEEEELIDRLEQERDETEGDIGEIEPCDCSNTGTDSASEVSDSATTESRGCKISWSSDSIDALEEDDLEACSSSRPELFQFYTPCLKETDSEYPNVFPTGASEMQIDTVNDKAGFDPLLCFLQLSHPSDCTAEQRESPGCLGVSEQTDENELNAYTLGCRLYDNNIMEYYSLCSNVSPASSGERNNLGSPENGSPKDLTEESAKERALCEKGQTAEVETLILSPPPGFGDSSSEEEFFDAAERLTPTQASPGSNMVSIEEESTFNFQINGSCNDLEDSHMSRQNKKERRRIEKESNRSANSFRKRRSFLQTDYTSQVTFPLAPSRSLQSVDHVCCYEREPHMSSSAHSQTVSSFNDTEGEPALLETKPLAQLQPGKENKAKKPSTGSMEMEPDTMETKSVTDSIISSISATRFRTDQEAKEVVDRSLLVTPCGDGIDDSNICAYPPCTSGQAGPTSPSDTYFHLKEINGPEEEAGVGLISRPAHCIAPLKTGSSIETSLVEHEQAVGEYTISAISEGKETRLNYAFEMEYQKETVSSCAEAACDPSEWCAGRQSKYVGSSKMKDISSSSDEKESEQHSYLEKDTADLIPCMAKEGDNALSKEKNGKDVNEEALQQDDDKKQLGVSNTTELLFDLNGISGILTHLSMSFFKEKNDEALLCQQSNAQHTKEREAFLAASEKDPQVQGRWTCKEEGQLDVDVGKGQGFLLSLKPFKNIMNPSELGNNPDSGEKGHSEELLEMKGSLGLPPVHTTHLPVDGDPARDSKMHSMASPLFAQRDNITGARWENSNFIPYCSDQSPICASPEGDNEALLSSNTDAAFDSPNIQNESLLKVGEENCSCRLSYANCFSGLDAEVDDDNIDSEQSGSSFPMTTPPSSGSLLSVDLNLFDLSDGRKEANSPLNTGENLMYSQYHFETLGRLENRTCKMTSDFGQLQDHVIDLQKIFETYSGSTLTHPQDKCAVHFSEDKQALCVASRKLMSSCQEAINVDQTSKQIQVALHYTFQNLIDLTRVCLQFTGCDRCSRRQIAVLTNLKDVVCTYHQFVQAARKACERDCSDLSIKLLARQCTALTAAAFCLTQQFRTLTSV